MAGSTRVLERLQIGERAFFVASHQTAVAGDIRRQHRRQPSFNALANQKSRWIGDPAPSVEFDSMRGKFLVRTIRNNPCCN
jgi:hypothetical protein